MELNDTEADGKPHMSCSPAKSAETTYAIVGNRQHPMELSWKQEECFICGKRGGNLISCGKKYTSLYFCTTKFHQECIEDYNAAEYSVSLFTKDRWRTHMSPTLLFDVLSGTSENDFGP
ncbi:hypothetical protein KIN20_008859, partial [Parelaphostrongylus tenuis]